MLHDPIHEFKLFNQLSMPPTNSFQSSKRNLDSGMNLSQLEMMPMD